MALSVAAGALLAAVASALVSAFLQPVAPRLMVTTDSAISACFQVNFIVVPPLVTRTRPRASDSMLRTGPLAYYCPFVSLLALAPGILVVSVAGFLWFILVLLIFDVACVLDAAMPAPV